MKDEEKTKEQLLKELVGLRRRIVELEVLKGERKRPGPVGSTAHTILTPRECEVLQLLAEGKTTKQIASLLYISAKTIETHRQHIMRKLDMHNLPELTKYALREGLTSL